MAGWQRIASSIGLMRSAVIDGRSQRHCVVVAVASVVADVEEVLWSLDAELLVVAVEDADSTELVTSGVAGVEVELTNVVGCGFSI